MEQASPPGTRHGVVHAMRHAEVAHVAPHRQQQHLAAVLHIQEEAWQGGDVAWE